MATTTFYYIQVSGPTQEVLEKMQRIFGGRIMDETDRMGQQHRVLNINTTHDMQIKAVETLRRYVSSNYPAHLGSWKIGSIMSSEPPYLNDPVIIYVHEPDRTRTDGRCLAWVTELRKDWRDSRGKKRILESCFSIDYPGTWFEGSNEWNCHADGCDHLCRSLEEAVARGTWINDMSHPLTGERKRYEFRRVSKPYMPFQTDPADYHLEQAEPMAVDFETWKQAWDEENHQIELRWQQEHQQAATL